MGLNGISVQVKRQMAYTSYVNHKDVTVKQEHASLNSPWDLGLSNYIILYSPRSISGLLLCNIVLQ